MFGRLHWITAPLVGALLVWTSTPTLAQRRAVPSTLPPIARVAGPETRLGSDPQPGYAAGWAAYMRAKAAFQPGLSVPLRRLGYGPDGLPTIHYDTLRLTQALRGIFPVTAPTTLRGDQLVALSDYVYATDFIQGAANNSNVRSPAPTCNWSGLSRRVVANSLTAEAVCFHRNARRGSPVAAVRFRATDGTLTRTCLSNSLQVSPELAGQTHGDRNAVLVYRCTIDITDLFGGAAGVGAVRVDADAYPWIGAADSVASTDVGSPQARGWSPRYWRKDPALFAAPVYAFVCPTSSSCPGQTTPTAGNDSTGLWSTNIDTARNTPFASMFATAATGAIPGITQARNTAATNSRADGLVLMIGSGGVELRSITSGSIAQQVGHFTITRAPGVAQSAAVLNITANTSAMRLGSSASWATGVSDGALTIRDVTLVRTTTNALVQGVAASPSRVTLQDVALDNGGFATTIIGSNNAGIYYAGVTVTNPPASGSNTANPIASVSAGETRLLRGVAYTNGTATPPQVEGWLVLGSRLTNATIGTSSSRDLSGGIFAFNTLSLNSVGSDMIALPSGGGGAINGYALIQSVIECNMAMPGTSSTQIGLSLSRDSGTGSIANLMVWNNSQAAWGNSACRDNVGYDETPATARWHPLWSVIGNIVPIVYNKGDDFIGADGNGSPQPATAPARAGNWSVKYGVGWAGNLVRFFDGVGNRAFYGLGLNSLQGTNVNTDGGANPLFVDYRANSPITLGQESLNAGAGGGDYRLQAGSPCKGRVPVGVLAFDLDGNARQATGDSCGAYR